MIADLKDGERKVNIQGKVTEKPEPRQLTTRFGKTQLSNATIEDDSGSIALPLWGEDADKVQEGVMVKIENGYVSSYNGSLQLNVGKYGKLTVLDEE